MSSFASQSINPAQSKTNIPLLAGVVVDYPIYLKELKILLRTNFHGKTLVPPGGTNGSVGGTNSTTNGIKRKYPPH